MTDEGRVGLRWYVVRFLPVDLVFFFVVFFFAVFFLSAQDALTRRWHHRLGRLRWSLARMASCRRREGFAPLNCLKTFRKCVLL